MSIRHGRRQQAPEAKGEVSGGPGHRALEPCRQSRGRCAALVDAGAKRRG
eukprot:CAMPEP_0198695288 /NCGR_PEP_ID=MMETSP1468-20131203/285019_1 /TAXON_ID=1461545 /ORGANISM="Mantoniella sp, Strain CCMP1436" /LENGTH=49 /DNA_ID= /DNA_START= /DNA_END= /DNA_ORIENTATION=